MTHALGVPAMPSEPVTELMERAREARETDPLKALDVANQAADMVTHSGDVVTEREIRIFILLILRDPRTPFEVPRYRTHLARMEEIVPQNEPDRSNALAWLSVLRAELALYLNEVDNAVRLGRAAVRQTESLPEKGTQAIAKVILGTALVRAIPDDTYQGPEKTKWVDSFLDPAAFNEALTLLEEGFAEKLPEEFFPFVVRAGKEKLAFLYNLNGQFKKALSVYRELEPLPSSPPSLKAEYILNIANAESAAQGKFIPDEEVEKAWQLIQQEANENLKANILLRNMGYLLGSLRPQRAIEGFSQAAEILSKEPSGSRYILLNLNSFIIPRLEGLREPDVGTKILEKAVSLPGIVDNPSIALPLYAKLSGFYAAVFDYKNFQEIRSMAESANKKTENWKAIQEILFNEAAIRRFFDPMGAATAYRAAMLTAYRGTDDSRTHKELVFDGFRKAINIAMEVGFYQDAIDFSLTALTVLKTDRDDDPFETVIQLLIDTGRAMTKVGRLDLADDAITLALGLLPKVSSGWEQPIRLAASEFYSLIGEEEFGLFQLNLVKSFGPSKAALNTIPDLLLHRARILRAIGNHFAAETVLTDCISQARKGVYRRPDAELACRWQLYRLLWEVIGDYDEAVKQAGEGFKLAAKHEAFFAIVEMNQLLDVFHHFHHLAASGEILTRQKQLLERFQQLPTTARIHAYRSMSSLLILWSEQEMGKKHLDWGTFDKELAALQAEPYLSTSEYDYLLGIGRALKVMGENKRSLLVLEDVAERLEFVRGLLTNPRLALRLGAEINDVFNQIVDTYLKENSSEGVMRALQAAEANRGRSVRHFKETSDRAPNPVHIHGSPIEKARAKLEYLRKVNGYELTKEELDTSRELITLSVSNEGLKHNSSTTLQRKPLPVVDLAKIQSNLAPTDATIMYHLSSERFGAWVLRKRALHWINLGESEKAKLAIVRLRTELLSHEPEASRRFSIVAREAFRLLVGPIMQHIADARRLTIIPDVELFSVPFEALEFPVGGKHLIEAYTISYQMSLHNTSGYSHEPSKVGERKNVLLIGNPTYTLSDQTLLPLAGAEREVESIKHILKSENVTVYSGQQASKEQVLPQLEKATVIHFATHGVVNERYPWSSYLALAGNTGKLTLDEVPKTELTADLVVLSACESGRGRILAGEGVWGFQSQFLAAGSKNVIGSLWRVEDESTAILMEEFYKGVVDRADDYADALRAAKLKLLQSERWNTPYYWAPFVLYYQPISQDLQEVTK
jgi:CHAT domain-containing protein